LLFAEGFDILRDPGELRLDMEGRKKYFWLFVKKVWVNSKDLIRGYMVK